MDVQQHQQQNLSEIAQFLERWDREVEAIQQGLKGFAVTARHDFINRRMQAIGEEKMLALLTLEAKKAVHNRASSEHTPKLLTDQDSTLDTVAVKLEAYGGQS